jgi:hypothetical protein
LLGGTGESAPLDVVGRKPARRIVTSPYRGFSGRLSMQPSVVMERYLASIFPDMFDNIGKIY